MTTDDDNTYSGPRTEAEWNTWARQHDRPVWNWPDVWTEGTQQ
jgi:hypothetical protein